MIFQADDTARKVRDVMVAENAERVILIQGSWHGCNVDTVCCWCGRTRTSCRGTSSSHGTYQVSYCGRPGRMCT